MLTDDTQKAAQNLRGWAMAARYFTPRTREQMDEETQEMIDDAELEYSVPHTEWPQLDLPTGKMPYRVEGDHIVILHTHFVEHGRTWTANNEVLHEPKKAYLMLLCGGSAPF